MDNDLQFYFDPVPFATQILDQSVQGLMFGIILGCMVGAIAPLFNSFSISVYETCCKIKNTLLGRTNDIDISVQPQQITARS